MLEVVPNVGMMIFCILVPVRLEALCLLVKCDSDPNVKAIHTDLKTVSQVIDGPRFCSDLLACNEKWRCCEVFFVNVSLKDFTLVAVVEIGCFL